MELIVRYCYIVHLSCTTSDVTGDVAKISINSSLISKLFNDSVLTAEVTQPIKIF